MKSAFLRVGLVTLAACLVSNPLPVHIVQSLAIQPAPVLAAAEIPRALASRFVPNLGQFPASVAFVAHGSSQNAFVTTDGQLGQVLGGANGRWSLRESFGSGLVASGADPDTSNITYVSNSGTRSSSGFRSVAIQRAWAGIDIQLAISDGRVERLFLVAPGADASTIEVQVEGADGMHIDSDGALVFQHGTDRARLSRPFAFQWINGKRQEVAVRYRVGASLYGFAVANYDRRYPLTIDPVMQSSYFGGDHQDLGLAIAVDARTGDVFIGGETSTPWLEGVVGGAMPTLSFATGGFIARFSSDLTRVYQVTYVEGSGYLGRLAINQTTGDVYGAGATSYGFIPKTEGSANPGAAGHYHPNGAGYILRLNHGLTELLAATYFAENVSGMELDHATGDLIVAGNRLPDDHFPADIPSAIPVVDGAGATVARINPQLTRFLGYSLISPTAARLERIRVAMNQSTGSVYVAGIAEGTPANLQNTAGAFQPNRAGTSDAFVVAFSGDLGTLYRSTYLGGQGGEGGLQGGTRMGEELGLAVSPITHDVYISGHTTSTDFPGTGAGALPTALGGLEAYVARLSSDLAVLRSASYLGGFDTDIVKAVAIAPDTGDVYVAGNTRSTDFASIAGGAITSQFTPSTDRGFISRFDPTLALLKQSTFYVGAYGDNSLVFGIAFDPALRSIYLVGFGGGGLPNTAGGAFPDHQPCAVNGCADAFVARLNIALTAAAVDVLPDDFAFYDQTGAPPATQAKSNVVRLTGIDGLVPLHVSGGEYSIDGGDFSSADGSVGLHQHLQLRLPTAPTNATTATMQVTVGPITKDFSVFTSSGADSTPQPFAFTDSASVRIDSEVVSSPVRIEGLTTQTGISVSGGTYSIDGSPFTSDAGMVHGGQTVQVAHQASHEFSTVMQSVLTVGGVSAAFNSTTEAQDLDPDPIRLWDSQDHALCAWAERGAFVSGINGPTPVSIENGEYAIWQDFTSAPGTIQPRQIVRFRQKAPCTFSTTGVTTIRIGNLTTSFSVTTEAKDTEPSPISVESRVNAPLNTYHYVSLVPWEFNTTIPITIEGGEYAFSSNGPYTSAPGEFSPNSVIYVRVMSASTYSTEVVTKVRVGDTVVTWSTTTMHDPDAASGSGGGGSLGLQLVLGLACVALTRRRRAQRFPPST